VRSERFRLLVAGMIDYAIFMLDPGGHIVTWNAGAQRLKGYQADEIMGRHFSCFYPLEDLESGKPARELEMALTEGRSADEGWRLRKDGTRFWADVVITAVRDEAGHLRGFSKVTRDLTQRKQADEALRASEERYRLLVAGMIDYAIFMLDPGGHIVTWNAGAQRLKGYQAHEIMGRHFSCFYAPEDLEGGKPARELEMALTEGRSADEGWRLRKDGTRFWADVVITAVRDEAGNLRGFSKVTRDLTQRKEAEESIRRLNGDLERRVRDRTTELERVNAQLKELGQRKDDLVNNLSHELRTPLTIIRESIAQVSDGLFGEVPADQKRHLDKSLVNVDDLAHIVNNLLDVSKLENLEEPLLKKS